MRVPSNIEGTDKVYMATWAALLAVQAHNQLGGGRIEVVAFPAVPVNDRDGVDRQATLKILEQRNAIFLGFAAGKQFFPIGPTVLAELASQQHLNRCVTASFANRPGGETLVEIYRFLPSPNCTPSP